MPQELLYFYLLCFGSAILLTSFLALKGRKDMVVRGITTMVLLHVMTAILWGGEVSCSVFAVFLAFVGGYEASGVSFAGVKRVIVGGLTAAIAFAIAFAIAWFDVAWVIPVWLLLIVFTFAVGESVLSNKLGVIGFTSTIVAIGCAALMSIAEPVPSDWIALILLAQFNDILALLAGKRFGKRRLFPKLSPNKSVEGYVGALLGFGLAIAVCLTILPVFDALTLVQWLVLAPALWVALNAGDLIFSKFKRVHQVKDFSAVLPGHGGIMDRFDSFLVAAPVWWLFVSLGWVI